MMLLVAGLLALLCVIAVVYPFLRREPAETGGEDDSQAAVENAGLESVLDAIRTLQLERQLNRVTEEAYEEQLLAYRLEAASLLRRRDESQGSGPEYDLERHVLLARLAANGVSGEGRVCEECASAVPSGADACPACGQSRRQAGPDRDRASDL